MRTRRREVERDRRARREADRAERAATEATESTVADPPRTVTDLLELAAAGAAVTYEEAALVGGIEEAVEGAVPTAGEDGAHGGW